MFSLTKCHLLLEEQSPNLLSTYLETKAGPGVRAGSWQRTLCAGPHTSDTPATLKHNGHQLQEPVFCNSEMYGALCMDVDVETLVLSPKSNKNSGGDKTCIFSE